MADRTFAELLNAVQSLTNVLERDFEYRQGQAEKAKGEPRTVRGQQEQLLNELRGANAYPTDWGQGGGADRTRRAAGQQGFDDLQRNLMADEFAQRGYLDNLPPDSPLPRSGGAPVDRTTGFATDLRGTRGLPPYRADTFANALEDDRPTPPDPTRFQQLRKAYSEAQGGPLRSLRSALGQFSTPLPNNLPPDAVDAGNGSTGAPPSGTGRGSGSLGGGVSPGPGGDPLHVNDPDTGTAMTWALLGEHGGPQFLRNAYLGSWGLQRSIDWGQQNVDVLRRTMTNNPDSWTSKIAGVIPGVSEGSLGPISGALGLAKEHPWATYAAYATARGGINAVRGTFAEMRANQGFGQQFGYGPPTGGQTIFGFHNPLGDFSTAAQVGAAANMETSALQGRLPFLGLGSGLSGQQAQDVVQSLSGQGFRTNPLAGGGFAGGALSTLNTLPVIGGPAKFLESIFGVSPSGPLADIAQNLDRPLMQSMPGLTASDVNQFTPALRYGGTSISQLSDSLKNLGTEAQATNETIGEFTSSLHQSAGVFQGMGSSLQGATSLGAGFTNVTGLDPQIASQLAQNPLFQANAITQYGILPSGLGDMNAGAFASNASRTVQMYASVFGGLNRDSYIKGPNGQHVLIESGQQKLIDMIASQTGLDSNVVKQMLVDAPAQQARATAETYLGSTAGSGTGLGQYIDRGQSGQAQTYWNQDVLPQLRKSGLSAKQISQLSGISNMGDRLTAAQKDISQLSKNDPANAIRNNPDAQTTVQVQFTGAAAKFFQQVSPSLNKQKANAGGSSFGSILNSVGGDLESAGKIGLDAVLPAGVGELLGHIL